MIQIGHDAAGVIPEGMMIDFKEAAKGAADPYETMMNWCERTQSKAILGGTLTSQADGATSTNALGNVHNEVRHDLMVSDGIQLAGTLTRDLVYPLLALNVGGIEDVRRCPRFVFDLREPEDLSLYAESIPKLVDVGMPVPVAWVQEKLRIPVPSKNEPVLQRQSLLDTTPAAATGFAALTRQDDQDEFDVFTDELASDWERITDPLISPIIALAAEVESYEEFLVRLPELIKDMDTEALTEALAEGQFAAAIYGRARNQQEN